MLLLLLLLLKRRHLLLQLLLLKLLLLYASLLKGALLLQLRFSLRRFDFTLALFLCGLQITLSLLLHRFKPRSLQCLVLGVLCRSL